MSLIVYISTVDPLARCSIVKYFQRQQVPPRDWCRYWWPYAPCSQSAWRSWTTQIYPGSVRQKKGIVLQIAYSVKTLTLFEHPAKSKSTISVGPVVVSNFAQPQSEVGWNIKSLSLCSDSGSLRKPMSHWSCSDNAFTCLSRLQQASRAHAHTHPPTHKLAGRVLITRPPT